MKTGAQGSLFCNLKRYGLIRIIFDVGLRAVKKILTLHIFKCVFLVTSQSSVGSNDYSESEPEPAILSHEFICDFVGSSEYNLDKAFFERARTKGDICIGFTEDGRPISYVWYSEKPTVIYDRLQLNFSENHIYCYNGFTLPDCRGKHLLSIGLAYAKRYFYKQGYQGMIGLTEVNNYASLKGSSRSGFQKIGTIIAIKLFGRYYSIRSGGAKILELGLDELPSNRINP